MDIVNHFGDIVTGFFGDHVTQSEDNATHFRIATNWRLTSLGRCDMLDLYSSISDDTATQSGKTMTHIKRKMAVLGMAKVADIVLQVNPSLKMELASGSERVGEGETLRESCLGNLHTESEVVNKR